MKIVKTYQYGVTAIAGTLLFFIKFAIVILAFTGVLPAEQSISALLVLFVGSTIHALLAPAPSKGECETPEN